MSNESQEMKSSNYLDNNSNSNWEWHVNNKKAEIVTRHDHPKAHEHRADVTQVPIGKMVDNPDPIIGQAHRNSPHYYKDGKIKSPKNTNTEKGVNNMGYKEHRAFTNSLNPVNYGGKTGPTNTGTKKTNNEDEEKGQRELDHPKGKDEKTITQMRSDIVNNSQTKDSKQTKATVEKAQNVSPKGTEGKTITNTSGKSTSNNGSMSGNTTGGKGTTSGGHGASSGSSGGHGNGHGGGLGGSSGGHGGGHGGSNGGHGGGHGGR